MLKSQGGSEGQDSDASEHSLSNKFTLVKVKKGLFFQLHVQENK